MGLPAESDPNLLVGRDTSDDAGVYLLNPSVALIQTVDFFTPIVNDPYIFGQIAAANALSDVYAMGGSPLTALNICCFPIADIDKAVLRKILQGGIDKVHEARAALAGGHSVEDPELKYGLSVTGVVHPDRVITNAGLEPGQELILTKPLGTGIIATALKGKIADPKSVQEAVDVMCQLNAGACRVMQEVGVRGATDITGFGLLGHGMELAQASKVSLTIYAEKAPLLSQAREMASMGLVPGGSKRNLKYAGGALRIEGKTDQVLLDLLADAQTSGGILMGVAPDRLDQAAERLQEAGCIAAHIGHTRAEEPGTIKVVF